MLLSESAVRQGERVAYYARNALRLLVPPALARRRARRRLAAAPESTLAALADRVAYYAALPAGSELGADAIAIGDYDDHERWTYYFDLRRTLVQFDPRLRFHFLPGDHTTVPERATLIKSRPLGVDNRNSVLLKLNRIRHFYFVEDRVPYLAKEARVVWRGNARYEHRRRVLERFHAHPRCDFGHVGRADIPESLCKPRLDVREQLGYRYVLNIEGRDVATSLKWSMASNSLCLMTPPQYETWFMEGRLVPGKHYVALAPDCSDLLEKLDHFDAHPEEALAIIRNAQAHTAQFRRTEEEDLVELLVALRYFMRTGQRDWLGDMQPALGRAGLRALLGT